MSRGAWWLVGLLTGVLGGLPGCSPAAQPDAEVSAPPPFLWRIEAEPPSYLFGTVHLPDERVLRLDAEVQAALATADHVVLELDRKDLEAAAAEYFLEPPVRLVELLPPGLERRLQDYLQRRDLTLAKFASYKLWAFEMQLLTLDYRRTGPDREPLDLHLATRARQTGKQTSGLETTTEQLAVFESLTLAEQVASLEKTLARIMAAEADGTTLAEMVLQRYLSGDEEAILDLLRTEFDRSDPLQDKLYRKLLLERNDRMTRRIAAHLGEQPARSWFFAVGALHLPGEGGVVEQLRAGGFLIERRGAPQLSAASAAGDAP